MEDTNRCRRLADAAAVLLATMLLPSLRGNALAAFAYPRVVQCSRANCTQCIVKSVIHNTRYPTCVECGPIPACVRARSPHDRPGNLRPSPFLNIAPH